MGIECTNPEKLVCFFDDVCKNRFKYSASFVYIRTTKHIAMAEESANNRYHLDSSYTADIERFGCAKQLWNRLHPADAVHWSNRLSGSSFMEL